MESLPIVYLIRAVHYILKNIYTARYFSTYTEQESVVLLNIYLCFSNHVIVDCPRLGLRNKYLELI